MKTIVSVYTKIALLVVRLIAFGLMLWSSIAFLQLLLSVVEVEGHMSATTILHAFFRCFAPFIIGCALDKNSLSFARKLTKEIDG